MPEGSRGATACAARFLCPAVDDPQKRVLGICGARARAMDSSYGSQSSKASEGWEICLLCTHKACPKKTDAHGNPIKTLLDFQTVTCKRCK